MCALESVQSGQNTCFLNTALGNVSANVIEYDGAPVLEDYHYFEGVNYSRGVSFDEATNLSLNLIDTHFSDNSKADSLLMFKLGSIKAYCHRAMRLHLQSQFPQERARIGRAVVDGENFGRGTFLTRSMGSLIRDRATTPSSIYLFPEQENFHGTLSGR